MSIRNPESSPPISDAAPDPLRQAIRRDVARVLARTTLHPWTTDRDALTDEIADAAAKSWIARMDVMRTAWQAARARFVLIGDGPVKVVDVQEGRAVLFEGSLAEATAFIDDRCLEMAMPGA